MHSAKEALPVSFESFVVIGDHQRITTIGRHVFVEAQLQKDRDLSRVIHDPGIEDTSVLLRK